MVELFPVHLVVEMERRGVVLAERVVRHEDVVSGEVGEHAVRPMEHRRLDEDELVRADVDPVTGAHLSHLPILVVVPGDARRPLLGYDQLGVRRVLHDDGQRPRVVGLGVVGDDDVDLRRIDELADVVHELVRERSPDRVDENGLLVLDEVGVVRRAAMGAELVPVERPQRPVDDADPVHAFLQLYDHSCYLPRYQVPERKLFASSARVVPVRHRFTASSVL